MRRQLEASHDLRQQWRIERDQAVAIGPLRGVLYDAASPLMAMPLSFVHVAHRPVLNSISSSTSGWLPSSFPAHHALHGWLADSASLTARISTRCRRLRVEILFQGLARPHHDEAMLLGLRAGELACVREVLLIADEQPVVYARSMLRRQSLRGPWAMFAGIGARPLGAALFADPLISRGALRARRLDRRDARYRRIAARMDLADKGALWARRSCFVRHHQPLIVCEVFLPAIRELRK